MSAATVPVFDPQGVLRDVPQDQLAAAVKSGGMPAVKFTAPDKSIRFVPANRTQDAVQAGGQIMPFEQQDVKHPGFWSTLVDDVKGMAQGAARMGADIGSAAVGNPLPAASDLTATAMQMRDNMQHRVDEKRSLAYRAIAPVGEVLGVNVRGMEDSADEGDMAGVAGHATAVPALMAATEGLARGTPVALDAARGAASVVRPAAATALRTASDFVSPDVTGIISPRLAHAQSLAGKIAKAIEVPEKEFINPGASLPATPPKEVLQANSLGRGPQPVIDPAAGLSTIRQPAPIRPVYPGAPLPSTPPAELLQARTLAEGGHAPATDPADALGKITVPQEPPTPEPAAVPVPEPMSTTPDGSTIPRTLSGESALRQVLTGQDNANLMKIAKSRGINVTRESQLKPSIADKLLVDKIVDDFSSDELSNMRDTYLENTRMGRHNFGDIGAEANKMLSMQTYFPDVKVPLATTLRTQAAIAKAAQSAGGQRMAPLSDLGSKLKEAAASKSSASLPPKTAAVEDLTAILQESLKQAQQKASQ